MRDEKGRFIKGHPQSNTGRTHLKKGSQPWNKGMYGPDGDDRLPSGDKHHIWKGSKAGYARKHAWVYRWLTDPGVCVRCKDTTRRLHWHNISGEYKRIAEDWERLCTKCHTHHHRNWEKRVYK